MILFRLQDLRKTEKDFELLVKQGNYFGGKVMRTLKREITDDPIVQRIIYSLKENGKTASDLIKYLKVGKNIFDTWKFSGSTLHR